MSLKVLSNEPVSMQQGSLVTLATAGECKQCPRPCGGHTTSSSSHLFPLSSYIPPPPSLSYPSVGSSSVPLNAVIEFVRLSFSYEQYEVLDMLGGAVVKAAMVGLRERRGGEVT